MSNRAEYIDKLYAKMLRFNKRLDTLEIQMKQIKNNVGDFQNTLLEPLQLKIRGIEDKISNIKKSGTEAWDEIAEGAGRSFLDIKSAFKNAKTKF